MGEIVAGLGGGCISVWTDSEVALKNWSVANSIKWWA